jgi:Uma2 family endonuclease
MSIAPVSQPLQEIDYPDSDGKPIAECTLQFDWITRIKHGLDALVRDRPDVFVAGDLLWYPVEGDNRTRTAPDTMVAFGRPKGHRGCNRQWLEEGIAPQVVFEVQSQGNRAADLAEKYAFYQRFGVEEYYLYDPHRGTLAGYLRDGEGRLRKTERMRGWVSPRLGVRFDLERGELVLTGPDGQRIEPFLDVIRRAEAEARRAKAEREKRERLERKLRELGIDPDAE